MLREDIVIRDPFLFAENGTGYLVGTTDETCWQGKATGFLGYRTRDLVHFEGPFSLFEASRGFWADANFWRPNCTPTAESIICSPLLNGRESRGLAKRL